MHHHKNLGDAKRKTNQALQVGIFVSLVLKARKNEKLTSSRMSSWFLKKVLGLLSHPELRKSTFFEAKHTGFMKNGSHFGKIKAC